MIGLIVGGVGATMIMDSMPGTEGSPQERANKLEIELKQARNRIAALDAAGSPERSRYGQTFADHFRRIVDDVRAGRPVNPDDIFRVAQPMLQDLAPLFDRMRVKQQKIDYCVHDSL